MWRTGLHWVSRPVHTRARLQETQNQRAISHLGEELELAMSEMEDLKCSCAARVRPKGDKPGDTSRELDWIVRTRIVATCLVLEGTHFAPKTV